MNSLKTLATIRAMGYGLLAVAILAAQQGDLTTLAHVANKANGLPRESYVKIVTLCELSHCLKTM